MSLFALQVIPDRHTETAKKQATGSRGGLHVRRPVRGLQMKEPTFATMRLVTGNGSSIPIVDAGSNRIDPATQKIFESQGLRMTDQYSNFLLQNVNEDRAEKSQILETFGEAFIFLYGQRAKVFTFSGILLNTFDFNWEAEWWHNYEEFLRGTKCVENDARVYLSYDETLVGGYILGASSAKSTEQPNFVQFQFQLFVTSYSTFSKLGDPRAHSLVDKNTLTYSKTVSEEEGRMYRPTLLDPFAQSHPPKAPNWTKPGVDVSLESKIDLDTPEWADNLAKSVAGTIQSAWSYAKDLAGSVASSKVGTIAKTIIGSATSSSTPKSASAATPVGLEDAAPYVTALVNATGLANMSVDIRNPQINPAMLSGTRIRLPVGFAGSMVFDEDAKVELRVTDSGGKIEYSTFDKNDDEYIGGSSHYGSSIYASGDQAGKPVDPGFGGEEDAWVSGLEDMKRVQKQWEAAGFYIDPASYGSAATFFASPEEMAGTTKVDFTKTNINGVSISPFLEVGKGLTSGSSAREEQVASFSKQAEAQVTARMDRS